jgi:DNA polymerase III subunit epsilon
MAPDMATDQRTRPMIRYDTSSHWVPLEGAPRRRCRSMAHYVAFDFETTGLIAASDRIIEIGAVKFEAGGKELSRFESLVCPDRPVSPGAYRVHRLSNADLANAPPIHVVLTEFLDWLGPVDQVTLLAHHARFDAAFLGSEIARLGLTIPRYSVLDTLALARHRLPGAFNHKLDTLAELLSLDPEAPYHRAMADCLRVKALWLALDGEHGPRMAYTPFDTAVEEPPPTGWDELVEAISRGCRVRMRYLGGSCGTDPRSITPRRIYHQGGTAYLAAFCHLGGFEKVFRLDRIESYEVLINSEGGPLRPT